MLDRAPLILRATPRSGTPILQVGSQLRAHADSYSMPDCHLKNQLESTLHLFMGLRKENTGWLGQDRQTRENPGTGTWLDEVGTNSTQPVPDLLPMKQPGSS